jgi:hypothetical protein
MLNRKTLPIELRRMLTEANELCALAGGSLRSRQAIASIILTWKKTAPEKPAHYKPLLKRKAS